MMGNVIVNMNPTRSLVTSGLVLAVVAGAVVFVVHAASGRSGGSVDVGEHPVQPVSSGDSANLSVAAVHEPRELPPTADARAASELTGITGWINAPSPLTIAGLRGKLVLLDFWTYSCVNCIRTLPYLRQWHEKYSDLGLVVIGVHSPEFTFEKSRKNVLKAIRQYGLPYAVATDNDFKTWEAFNVLYWPTKFLIDANGYIRYSLIGEGRYGETERMIRELLVENGAPLDSAPVGTLADPLIDARASTGDPETSLTRELFAGYEWNDPNGQHYIRNPEYYYQRDMVTVYEDPGHRRNNFIFLHGAWYSGAESLVHGRTTENLEDYLAIEFNARSVNAVMSPRDEGAALEVVVTLDGEYLAPGQTGDDVFIREDGVSLVRVDGPRMYHLVELGQFGTHELALSSDSDQFSLSSLTFGAYPVGP